MSGWISVYERQPESFHGLILVTNNIEARNRHGNMSHVWLTSMLHHSGREFSAFPVESDHKVIGITHWRPAVVEEWEPTP